MNQKFTVGLYPVPNIPLVTEGMDLGNTVYRCAAQDGFTFQDGDVLVVAQKVVSKAEGAVVRLADVVPSQQAHNLAEQTGRDPRLCQVYLEESLEVLRVKGRMVITRHRLGFECSGAGVDRSNVAPHDEGIVVLLPRDPDASARSIQGSLRAVTGVNLAVIISDSFGRADREGSVGVAIGLAGMSTVELRQQQDLFDNPSNSAIALVDELAAAASLVMGQADERHPAVIVRGVPYTADEAGSIRQLLTLP